MSVSNLLSLLLKENGPFFVGIIVLIGIIILCFIIAKGGKIIIKIIKERNSDGQSGPFITKNIINIINKNNNRQQKNAKQNPPGKRKSDVVPPEHHREPVHKEPIDVKEIKLYSNGAKGKAFSSVFRKSFITQIGSKAILMNNTHSRQVVFFQWRVFDSSERLCADKTRKRTISSYGQFDTDICIQKEDIEKMKPGKYTTYYWINGKCVCSKSFELTEK